MDWELYAEADRRGLLTGEKKELYAEAQRRGLAPAMRRIPAQPDGAPQVAPPPAIAPQAPEEDPSVLGDAAKSAGIGLAQGGIGLATLPGNLESLGRMGIDKAGGALGFDPQLSKNQVLPTFNDAKAGIEKYTGEFYKPKTTAGKYARTIGEFAPLGALGAGISASARLANVLGPAFLSETAGQATAGTAAEPWARAIGGMAGGMVPNAAMRLVSPAARVAPDAVRAGHIANLENNGVTAITAGQRLGNKRIQGMEDAADIIPFGGARTSHASEQANEQFTTAALRHAGVQNAPRATGPVIDQAFNDLGTQFGALSARNSLPVDRQFLADIRGTVDQFNDITPPSMRPPLLENLHNDLQQAGAVNGQMSGEAYQALRSRIESVRRQSLQGDPQFAHALGEVRDHLDDAMSRSASPADQAAWTTARTQYRNLLAIEKAMSGAGENTANGLISPSQLRTAVKTQNKRSYVRGQNPLGELAKSGEAILKPLKSSGTAERSKAVRNFEDAGKAVALVGGGAAYGGALAPAALLGAGAVAGAPGAVARAFMSGPMQRWLANDRAIPSINAYANGRVGGAFRAPQAASDLVQQPALAGGMGPRYDDNGNLRQPGAFGPGE